MRLIFLMATIALLTFIVSPVHAFLSADAKITIKVLDETGAPVEGARVGAGFKTVRDSRGTVSTNIVKMTDHNGIFEGKESCDGHIGWNIKKVGYYEARGTYDFMNKTAFRWEPWNPVITTVLRKVEHPVPMYIRNTRDYKLEIPEADKDIGFDLMTFDWVAPYGQGEKADFIFNLKRRVVSRKNFDATLTIRFSNKHDGIQPHYEDLYYGSLFKLPRLAPESGYQNELVLHEWKNEKQDAVQRNFNFVDKDLNYLFRIRTKEKDGTIEEAIYGKILDHIDFSVIHSKTAVVVFKYYLNPDGTRNLEHNKSRNLFK